jgi:hypothetical protein
VDHREWHRAAFALPLYGDRDIVRGRLGHDLRRIPRLGDPARHLRVADGRNEYCDARRINLGIVDW